MGRKLLIWVFAVFIIPTRIFSQQDLLVDVFPLSVGNQWVFHHHSNTADYLSTLSFIDTGTTTLTIIDKSVYPESTRWQLLQTRNLTKHVYNFFGGSHSYWDIRDTTTFELIELHEGRHRLYRVGNEIEIRPSEFPFFYELSDTTMVYRYFPVDSSGTHTFTTSLLGDTAWPLPWLTYTFTFKEGVGPIHVHSESFLTGVDYGSNHVLLGSIITSVANNPREGLPEHYSLLQNFPNPFNPVTTIRFRTPERAMISLKVYDILGRELETLFSGEMEGGEHSIRWNAERFSSGVYIYALTAGGYTERKRMLLMR